MKKEVSPILIAAAVVIVLALVGYFGYRTMQPAPYTPSPGVASGDAPGTSAASQNQPMAPGERAYQQSLNAGGDTPGVPAGSAAPGADSGSPATGPQGQVHVAPD